MKWIDYESYIKIFPPKDFNFNECLIFLCRSNQEVLHKVKDETIYKLINLNDALTLCKVDYIDNYLKVEFPLGTPDILNRQLVGNYIWEWFDLNQDLYLFYQLANNDAVLKTLANKYRGLRIICIPDLFEALVWAILGQQINLTFAYTLKKRFVEQYGEWVDVEGERHWLFPTFNKIASLDVEELKQLQFTTRKAEYIIGIAKEMESGSLTKELLLQVKDEDQIRKSLMLLRGVGAWTTDYVMMKCLHKTSAFPKADVGLHNAVKKVLNLNEKPTIEELEEYSAKWEGWQAYATFYLWRSLYD